MSMRIYHIGLPKTGTTSLQKYFQDKKQYIGTSRPETDTDQHFNSITAFLIGNGQNPRETLPDDFFYSEELILAPRYKGQIQITLQRLTELVRPEDRVLVSTRHPADVLFSRYCERYRQLCTYSFKNSVLYYPIFEPYNYLNYKETLTTNHLKQFEFIDMTALLSGKSKVLQKMFGEYRVDKHENRRENKPNSSEYKVHFYSRPLSKTSEVLNNILCTLTKECKDPIGRIPGFNYSKNPSYTFISKPSYALECKEIQQQQAPGLTWLRDHFNINYLS